MLLKVLPELKKDGPFFTIVGFLCGMIQYVGYSYFDRKEWGSELLQEHIAFGSLLLMVMFLWFFGFLLHWKVTFPGRNYLDELLTHISHRAVAFALVATFVVLGFALAVLSFKNYGHGIKFLSVSLFFLALAETAAHRPFQGERSTCYLPAMGFVIATPFTF